MKVIAPQRYLDFQCIAGKCRHSCCIGWEIDIDPESLRRFQQATGEIGERLRANIQLTEDGACFRLQGTEERCPFLNASGLCDLIITLGEDALCQICTDHPRFRSFFSDRTEIGLGLCCETAAHLLLGTDEPMRLTVIADDGLEGTADPFEADLLFLRDKLFEQMQDRTLPVAERVEKLLPTELIDWQDWTNFLSTLERLDERWAELLKLMPHDIPYDLPDALAIPMEQLMCCLIYRHLPGAMEDGDTENRIRFCALMWQLIARLCMGTGCATLEALVELVRLYSSEIEYSIENTCAILDKLAKTDEGR